jgi:hypothetical protein
MQKYLIHTILGILLLTIVGMQLVMSPIVGQPVDVSLEIKPETLNLKKQGVIMASIRFLNSSYNVSDIACESIRLRVESASDWVKPLRCVVEDGELIVGFDAVSVNNHILSKLVHMQIPSPKAKHSMNLVVEGTVEGEYFKGSDQIEVMLP